MVSCKVCQKEFENDASLHRHLRAHSLRKVEYYQKYYPRYDLHTGDIIKFKSKEQYFSSDFNSRLSLKHWLKKQNFNPEIAVGAALFGLPRGGPMSWPW